MDFIRQILKKEIPDLTPNWPATRPSEIMNFPTWRAIVAKIEVAARAAFQKPDFRVTAKETAEYYGRPLSEFVALLQEKLKS